MKKFLALLLAAMMLLSCTTAFAATTENMTHEISEAKNFDHTDSVNNTFNGADSASQSTDVWLQVEASGQIDVTVPLVAVFKTNIDGGKDTISNSYVITNNSSANVAVTKVVITDHKTSFDNNGDATNMEMVAQLPATDSTTYNQYCLTFKPEDHYNSGSIWPEAGQIVASTAASTTKFTQGTGTAPAVTYTLDYDTNGGTGNEARGLWLIERKGTGDNASYVQMDLDTSKLSFVTKKDTTAEGITTDYGVKLFTVEYTVKIDNSNPVSTPITGTMTGSTYTGRTDGTENLENYTYNYTNITTTTSTSGN